MNKEIALKCLKSFVALLIFIPAIAHAGHYCPTPLVLDLDGDGYVATTHAVRTPVWFDIDADGETEQIGWTSPVGRDAFLWVDFNGNGTVDDGSELFGDATLLPDGSLAANGFEALAVYDTSTQGGDEDGAITPVDLIWPHLLLWVDANHDGLSQEKEVSSLDDEGVVAIDLEHVAVDRTTGTLNKVFFSGSFYREVEMLGERFVRSQTVEDVLFQEVAAESH